MSVCLSILPSSMWIIVSKFFLLLLIPKCFWSFTVIARRIQNTKLSLSDCLVYWPHWILHGKDFQLSLSRSSPSPTQQGSPGPKVGTLHSCPAAQGWQTPEVTTPRDLRVRIHWDTLVSLCSIIDPGADLFWYNIILYFDVISSLQKSSKSSAKSSLVSLYSSSC